MREIPHTGPGGTDPIAGSRGRAVGDDLGADVLLQNLPDALIALSPSILVVEDNPITRKMVRVTREGAGYAVVEAGDGGHAPRQARVKGADAAMKALQRGPVVARCSPCHLDVR